MKKLIEFLIKVAVINAIIRADEPDGNNPPAPAANAGQKPNPAGVDDIIGKINASRQASAGKQDEGQKGAQGKSGAGGVTLIDDKKPEIKEWDEKKFLTEHFEGKYKSLDELKEAHKKVGVLPEETAKELESLRGLSTKYKEVETELEKERGLKYFNNEELYKLDRLYGEDKNAYEALVKMKYSSDPMDILRQQFISEHPEYKDSLDVVDDLIKDKYKFSPEPEKNEDDEVIQGAKERNDKQRKIIETKMKLEADEARKKALSALNKYELPKRMSDEEKKIQKEKSDTEAKEKASKFVKDWKPGYNKYFEKPEKETFKISISKDKSFDFDFELDTKDWDEIKKITDSLIISNALPEGMAYTDEALSNFAEVAKATYIASDFAGFVNKIGLSLLKQYDSATDQEMKELLHNTSLGKVPDSKKQISRTKQLDSINEALKHAGKT